ncbi:hypothetical protein IWW54_006598, partial [Coemansia sp. RSA 2705]
AADAHDSGRRGFQHRQPPVGQWQAQGQERLFWAVPAAADHRRGRVCQGQAGRAQGHQRR